MSDDLAWAIAVQLAATVTELKRKVRVSRFMSDPNEKDGLNERGFWVVVAIVCFLFVCAIGLYIHGGQP
jgi:hypothetical protein